MFSIGLPLLLFQGGYTHNLAFSILALFCKPPHDPSHISELSVEIDFSRRIILIWKMRKVCPHCYWATSGSRKLFSVSPPCSCCMGHSAVELMLWATQWGFRCPSFQQHHQNRLSPSKNWPRKIFSAITGGKTHIQTQQSLVCKESHVLLCAVMRRIMLNAQVSLLARLAISLHSLHSFLFTGIYTVYSKYIKEK